MSMTQNFRHIYSLYQQNRDLISVGAYQPGSDPAIDRAVRMRPQMLEFIKQTMNQSVNFEQSRQQLGELLANTGDEEQPQAVDELLDQEMNQAPGG